ncbi:acriflavine resistance protein B [Bordetella pertussis]|nr:acriflavine resistance protein B [Bordetella pertussis]
MSITEINNTLATAWGSSYVNDFIDRGRVKKVFVQGEASSRMLPQDLDKWYVRNNAGDMVPFSAFSSAQWTFGPQKLNRYNGVPSYNIQGQAAPGYSSGDAMAEMERDGAAGRQAAAGHRLRLDRPVVRGAPVGRAGARAVRDLADRGVPVPGRAL